MRSVDFVAIITILRYYYIFKLTHFIDRKMINLPNRNDK